MLYSDAPKIAEAISISGQDNRIAVSTESRACVPVHDALLVVRGVEVHESALLARPFRAFLFYEDLLIFVGGFVSIRSRIC